MPERVMPRPTPRPPVTRLRTVMPPGPVTSTDPMTPPAERERLRRHMEEVLRQPQHLIVHPGPPMISTVLWREGHRPYDQDVPEPDLPLLLVTWTD